MRLRNAFRISGNCWGLLIKTLILQVLIIAIVVALSVLLFADIVPVILDVLSKLDLGNFLANTVNSIVEGTFDAQQFADQLVQIIEEIRLAIEGMPNFINRLELSYIFMFVIVCVFKMLIAAPDITVAMSLNEFMTTNSKRPFTWYFFKKFWVGFRFALLQFLVTFPLDLVVIFASLGFYFLFLITLKWWTVIPAAIIALVLYSLRFSMYAFWLPGIADGLTVTGALKNNFSKIAGNFWRVFLKNFVVLAILAVLLTVVNYFIASQVTAILSALVSLVGFYFIKCINMVEYFESQNKPYFSKKINIYGLEESKKPV